MKKSKRILSGFLAVVLALSLVTPTAFAAQGSPLPSAMPELSDVKNDPPKPTNPQKH